jgi:hypothetical protein
MTRKARVAALVAGAVTASAGVARASGNELGALDDLLFMAAVVVCGVPWAISWWLLSRKDSPRIWFLGSLMSALATAIIFFATPSSDFGGPSQLICVGVGLLPAAAHQLKRVRAELRSQRGGDAAGGSDVDTTAGHVKSGADRDGDGIEHR